jgi:hypothetical protein
MTGIKHDEKINPVVTCESVDHDVLPVPVSQAQHVTDHRPSCIRPREGQAGSQPRACSSSSGKREQAASYEAGASSGSSGSQEQ